jgi:hypothetical protein
LTEKETINNKDINKLYNYGDSLAKELNHQMIKMQIY